MGAGAERKFGFSGGGIFGETVFDIRRHVWMNFARSVVYTNCSQSGRKIEKGWDNWSHVYALSPPLQGVLYREEVSDSHPVKQRILCYKPRYAEQLILVKNEPCVVGAIPGSWPVTARLPVKTVDKSSFQIFPHVGDGFGMTKRFRVWRRRLEQQV